MRPFVVVASTLLVLSAFARAECAGDGPLLGFTTETSRVQRDLEKKFDAELKADDLRAWMKQMSARPHHLGSPYDKANAEFIASQFRSWGFRTKIETFEVLFPTPLERVVELTKPERFTARLEEPEVPGDHTSGGKDDRLPTYNAYSADGDVTAELVYVNFGVPKDYEELERRGISVRGKIVIARYGGSWRGIKPKVAAEHGAVGCLIYSDPHEDGYFQGDVYPSGSFRSEQGAQRGSVMDIPLYSGDPLTPGVGATAGQKRLKREEAPALLKIPVLPLSHADALPMLRALKGPVAPSAWRGALPLTYHLGGGPATVHLKTRFDWKLVPAYDVIATLPGSEHPDEWVIRGNHHDAWVFGADDPLSGAVALMEEAKGCGRLAAGGWRPKRTLVYTVWDGEEEGLLGSTEWVETHEQELRDKAVLYLNSDGNSRGFLSAGGSHALERLVGEVAGDVVDPERGVSVLERARAHRLVDGTPEQKKELQSRKDLPLAALGSGSDYTPFLQHAGIPALNVGFSGEAEGGSYHSIYDSFDYYQRFGDPSFRYGVLLARVTGRIMLRTADADVLPYDFTQLADTIDRYAREVARVADDLREETAEQNRMIKDGSLLAAADPTRPFVLPAAKEPVPFLNFAPLQNAVAHLRETAKSEEAARLAAVSGGRLDRAKAEKMDRALARLEQDLVRAEGLPRRPWYRHLLYAPGFYTGYGVKTMPGVREAIEQRRWSEANEQIEILGRALEALTQDLEQIRSTL